MTRPEREAWGEAEAIAARALLFLASDESRLGALLAASGLTPQDLRDGADTAAVQSGVLAHLLADETLLLVFGAEAGVGPEQIAIAAAVLDGQPVSADVLRRLRGKREPKPGRGFR